MASGGCSDLVHDLDSFLNEYDNGSKNVHTKNRHDFGEKSEELSSSENARKTRKGQDLQENPVFNIPRMHLNKTKNTENKKEKNIAQDDGSLVFSIPPMHLNKNSSARSAKAKEVDEVTYALPSMLLKTSKRSENSANRGENNGDAVFAIPAMHLNTKMPKEKTRDPTKFLAEIQEFQNFLVENRSNQFQNTELIYQKLSNLQSLLTLCLQNFVPNNSVDDIFGGETMSIKSDSDASTISGSYMLNKYSPESRLNCQFCFEVCPSITELGKHVRESCSALISQVFDNSRPDYSCFQLLPSNKLKCNVCVDSSFNYFKDMVQHMSERQHKGNVRKRNLQARNKQRNQGIPTTQFIFCSVCKVLVPDNQVQFNQHLQNEEHDQLRQMKAAPSRGVLRQQLMGRGIHYAFDKDNNCLCYLCNNTSFKIDLFNEHNNAPSHQDVARTRNNRGNIRLFCRCCNVDVIDRDLDYHIRGDSHLLNSLQDQDIYMKFMYCTFCETKCDNIEELAKHQKNDCAKIWANRPTSKSTPMNISTFLQTNTIKCSLCNHQMDEHKWVIHEQTAGHKLKVSGFTTSGATLSNHCCPVCQLIIFGGRESFIEHKHSKEHQMKIQCNEPKEDTIQRRVECFLCRHETNENLFAAHVQTTSHKNTVAEFSQQNISVQLMSCSSCNKSMFGTAEMLDIHKISKEHQANNQSDQFLSKPVNQQPIKPSFVGSENLLDFTSGFDEININGNPFQNTPPPRQDNAGLSLYSSLINQPQGLNLINKPTSPFEHSLLGSPAASEVPKTTPFANLSVNNSNKNDNGVKPIQNFNFQDEADSGEVFSINVQGNLKHQTESILKDYFSKFGDVRSVVLTPTQATINFSSKKSIEKVLKIKEIIKIGGEHVEIVEIDVTVNLSDKIKKFWKGAKGVEVAAKELSELPIDTNLKNSIANDLKNIINAKKYYIYGSYHYKLAFPSSTVDLFYEFSDTDEGFNGQKFTTKEDHEVLFQILTEDKFKFVPDKFVIKNINLNCHSPYILVSHEPSSTKLKLTFNNGIPVRTASLINQLIVYDQRVKPLVLNIKFWFEEHAEKLSGFSSYAILWLTIFFLQQKGIVPSLKLDKNSSQMIQGWKMHLKLVHATVKSQEHTGSQLVKDFFQFYATFNFQQVICTSLTKQFNRATAEDELRKHYTNNIELDLNLNRQPLVMLDPFEVTNNITKDVMTNSFNVFKHLISLTLNSFKY